MNTTILAHRFFHEPDKRGEYANVNTSFEYYTNCKGELVWRYYSYSTCVGEIRPNKKGELCLIISDTNYSNCTRKHLWQLSMACPYDREHIFYVPRVDSGFFYGDYRYIKGTYDFERVLKNIADMTEKDLRLLENRLYVQRNITLYDKYASSFNDMTKKEKRLRKSAKVKKVIDITTEKQQVWDARKEERRAKHEAERQAKMAEARERLEKFFNEGDKLDKIRLVFSRSYWEEELTDEMREFRNMLYAAGDEQGRRLSYVWLDGDMAKTSQHCQAPINDVVRLCKLWTKKQSLIGEKAGMYTVVENKPDYVKIGCHVIPKWNIELLCNKLNVA